IEQVPDNRDEGYAMLTQAYLRLPVPDIRAALLANEKQLQLPTADESLLAPARLLRGELLLKLQDREAARKVLARIGPGEPPASLSHARPLGAGSYRGQEAGPEAAPFWKAFLADPREKPAARARISYSLGFCYRHLNRPADAAHLWERVAER